jgi:hypothetical protein
MSQFTYEYQDAKTSLEKYEWDNTWWESTDVTNAPRVLYIGDSISCGARRIATEASGNTILFDGYGTSKAIDNPYLCASINMFALQQRERAAIIFNNGLHGWQLDDSTEYKEHYENVVKCLVKEYEGTPLFLVLSTPTADQTRDARIVVRNKSVLEIAKKYNLPTIDLYSVIDNNRDLISPDGVHMTSEGYRCLANEIIKNVRTVIK